MKFLEYCTLFYIHLDTCNYPIGFSSAYQICISWRIVGAYNSCLCFVHVASRHRDGVRGQVSNSAIDRILAPFSHHRAQDEMQIATRLRIGESPRDPPRHGVPWRENTLAVSGGVRARRSQSSSRHLGESA